MCHSKIYVKFSRLKILKVLITLSNIKILPGIMKKIQNLGSPVNRARPCTKHKP